MLRLIRQRELLEVLEQSVLLHARLHELLVVLSQDWLRIVAVHVVVLRQIENAFVDLSEVKEWVYWAALTLTCLEEFFGARILPLVWILFRSTSTASARRQRNDLTVGPSRVFLLDMGVKRGIRQVLLVAVLAVEVATPVVIFGATLSRNFYSIRHTAGRDAILRVRSEVLAALGRQLVGSI